ncbi:MAG: hypothetical protein ABS59_23895 [Methylobacterium sp. SCN 67-24]|nr:MAG: hypothetical protein ABS59_23895 [Methylobacterium sp. SCN 67-24]
MGGRGLVIAESDAASRELAEAFYANGEGFLRGAMTAFDRDLGAICYSLAIASELVLKAFLLVQGWTDDRCRREIRHDLERGLGSAKEAGLNDVPAGFGDAVRILNAYYPKHAFMDFAVPEDDPEFVAKARSAVAQLYETVGGHVWPAGGR